MKRIAVVLSQGQSRHPDKRKLEEEIVTALMLETGVDVTVVSNLYDLKPDRTGILALQGITGDLIVLSWMYARAAHWLLDRNDVRGQAGRIELTYEDDDESEKEAEAEATRIVEERALPPRRVYCLDLRASDRPEDFVEEVKRVAREINTQVVDLMSWVKGSPDQSALKRFQQPTNDTAFGGDRTTSPPVTEAAPSRAPTAPHRIEDAADRRWYPVIDFSRCTNCMECIDFCLFGVYGVDGQEAILVEQPDNCRKGCPACSRVCPENAIMFPQHKSPAIAGAQVAVEGLKIDLSKLFGAPDEGKDAMDVAARERDEQLLMAGRHAVGIPKRQPDHRDASRDDLDNLLDQLDDLDL